MFISTVYMLLTVNGFLFVDAHNRFCSYLITKKEDAVNAVKVVI